MGVGGRGGTTKKKFKMKTERKVSRLTQTASDGDTQRKRRPRSGASCFFSFEKQRGRKQPRVERKRACVCVCETERMGERGKGDGKGGEKEGVRDWVSSDCVSGQLHMFLIKVLTLWEQLHTRMLVFVIRADVLWSGGSPENTAGAGPSPLAWAVPSDQGGGVGGGGGGGRGDLASPLTHTTTCPHATRLDGSRVTHAVTFLYKSDTALFSPRNRQLNLPQFSTQRFFLSLLFSLLRL